MALFGSTKGGDWWLECNELGNEVHALERRLRDLESGKWDIDKEIKLVKAQLKDAKRALKEVENNYYE
jgi:predicted  nucleic acid-binding Zn-ribbon protein